MLTFNNKIVLSNDKLVECPLPPPEVVIGGQVWKTMNLAIDDGQGGIKTRTVNYGRGNVTEYYYNWPAASRVAETIDGWHLPSKEEFDTLISAVGNDASSKLKSTYGWTSENGTNDSKFTGLPAGRWDRDNFDLFGEQAFFWTTTSSQYASNLRICKELNEWGWVGEGHSDITDYYYSVRLIKDS